MTPLDAITSEWADCARCPLARTRSKVVVGERYDDPDASGPNYLLLVVGEAPGPTEDQEGRPFIGPSGQLLRDEILKPAGVKVAYLTNLASCFPGRDDEGVICPPSHEAISACSPRLEALAATLGPSGVLAVGRLAEAHIASPECLWARGLPHAAITHPAAWLRRGHPSPETRRQVAAAVGKVRRLLSVLEPRGCEHRWTRVGELRGDGKSFELSACLSCDLLVKGGRL